MHEQFCKSAVFGTQSVMIVLLIVSIQEFHKPLLNCRNIPYTSTTIIKYSINWKKCLPTKPHFLLATFTVDDMNHPQECSIQPKLVSTTSTNINVIISSSSLSSCCNTTSSVWRKTKTPFIHQEALLSLTSACLQHRPAMHEWQPTSL